jgi:transposase
MTKKQASRAAEEAAVAAHYAQLLGIGRPWQVKQATLDLLHGKVEIAVAWDESAAVVCPTCGQECPRHDHAPERTWRHLDVMQFTTLIRARLPRCACPEHGVVTVQPPWAEPGARFTLLFEAFAVEVIAACRSLTQAADLLELDWDSVLRIMARAVTRGLARRSTAAVRQIGLDEKSFKRGQRYVSLMTDLDDPRVLEVVAGRDTASAVALLETLPENQRAAVVAAAMDMGANFAAATRQVCPKAAIVHDRFHVSQHLNVAVDKVRREEHRRLLARGDASLTGTKFLWLQGTLPEGERKLTFDELCERNLKTARAWCHKETFAEFWAQDSAAHGQRFFKDWYRTVARSKLEPVKKVARMLQEHLVGLLTYFTYPITNALTEGFNSKIQAIKADARGFRNFANFRVRILFHCGKLDMAPVTQPSAAH